MRKPLSVAVSVLALAASSFLVALTAGATAAPALTRVTGFGDNPSDLNMYAYVPSEPAASPALLVAVHNCAGSAQAFYSGAARDYVEAADKYGFVIVFPEATREGHCFDVSTPKALKRDGGGDSTGIISMVRHAQKSFRTDPARTFLMGASSGAMMTNVLAAEYPDVFAAATVFGGVPASCFETGTSNGLWNIDCAGGKVIKTPEQWADAAHGLYPGYTGSYPRMQLWHGSTDDVLGYPNFGEEVKQWTALHGLAQAPTATDHPLPSWTRNRYGASGAQAQVEAVSIDGVGHILPQPGMAQRSIAFFGLDSAGSSATPALAASSPLPCDIYASGGTPCVAAHSSVRALSASYLGSLYQVRRSSDNTTRNIGVRDAGGVADAAAQDSFCAGTTCLITIIYDQSGKGNHLTQAPPGSWKGPAAGGWDNLADATAAPITVGGHKAYGVYIAPGTGYRNNKTVGIATGDQPEGIYAVVDGTHYNNWCCFDYGNAQTTNTADSAAIMETVYFGADRQWGWGDGNGPWVMGDLEFGLWSGVNAGYNPAPPINHRFVTAIVKGEPNHWSIRSADAQAGGVSTVFDGRRPNGYNPMKKQGAILLGIGGDNSTSGEGTFFEGVLTSGYPSNATESAVQANIVAAGYR